MGTPDSFIVEDTGCPDCGRPVRVLQTKILPYPDMDRIRLGETIPIRTDSGDLLLDIRDGRVLCWGDCLGCDASLNYYAIIKDNKWVGLELASVRKSANSPT